VKFLIDVNLPWELAEWIRERGHEAIYSADLLPHSAADAEIWNLARSRDMAIITKDADLVDISRRRGGPQVVWVRSGNRKRNLFKGWFDERLDDMFAHVAAGIHIIELR
jgi:predicted nuclease of predicted toxin-antitoxin system